MLANQRAFLDDLYKKMNMTSMDDWYKVSGADLEKHGGRALVTKYNDSIMRMLKTVYPEYLTNFETLITVMRLYCRFCCTIVAADLDRQLQ
jgi:hypothetical protein